MYGDIEEMLTRELRQVADHVEVPALPDLPADPPGRLAWQPMLVAAAVVLVALATLATLLGTGGGRTPQPAPPPTDVVTDDASEAAPAEPTTDPPTLPYLLDGRVHAGDRTSPEADEFWSAEGYADRWLAIGTDGTWSWSNGFIVQDLPAEVSQSAVISPNGEFLAWIDTGGELYGLQTSPDAGGTTVSVPVPVRDDDGVGTRIGAVTDDGWVIASGRGVGVLWRPFVVDAEVVDLAETAPGQLVWQATQAGIVAVDGSGDSRGPDSGRVYLADLTADGELTPIADLPNFALLDAAGDWVAWVPPGVLEGEVTAYDEISVRRIDGGDDGVLSPPEGWQFANRPFGFEDGQFLVAPVTNGERERMVRCSPALGECVLLDTP